MKNYKSFGKDEYISLAKRKINIIDEVPEKYRKIISLDLKNN
jgi:hypothetical protein